MKYLKLAISLLTVLPVNIREELTPGDSGRAAIWFPYIGIGIAILVACSNLLFTFVFPPIISAVLTMLVWIAATGGLHLDGVADCCDGLWNASTPQRRLEIMKDPHIGTFGVVGIAGILLLKTASLIPINPWPISQVFLVILLATSLSRWCILLAGLQPQARLTGMGAYFSKGLRKSALIWGVLPSIGIIALLGWQGLACAVIGLLWAMIVFTFSKRRLGGITGDVFGLTVESVECVILLSAIAIMR